MGKSSPATPDYAAAAQQQGAANQQTALTQSLLNNPNMITPYGTSTYNGGGLDSRPTVTQTLSDAEQAKLDKSNSIQGGALDILQNDLPNISQALSGPFGLDSKALEGYDPRYEPTAQTLTGINVPGQVQTSLNIPGSIQSGVNLPGKVQSNLDFSGAPGMPTADNATLKRVEDAVYGQGAQYLDPQFAQKKSDLTAQLANQGIVPGTTAYEREMLNFNNTSQQAYQDLRDSATVTGQDAMQKLYNEALAGRQQGVGEVATQGNFTNAAQQQGAQEALAQGNFANTAQQQGADQAATTGAFANTAQQQQLQNILAAFNAQNSGVAQQANIASNEAALANSGQAQNYSQYATNRTMPINMLNSILSSSQVNNPQFQPTTPTQIAPTPVLQGAQLQGQSNAANASANAGLWGSILGAGSKLGAAAISDRRLKSKIVRIGTRFKLPWYLFEVMGHTREGVMADEAEAACPAAVSVGSCGFKQVDYGRLACQM